jgi:hypothetical protein
VTLARTFSRCSFAGTIRDLKEERNTMFKVNHLFGNGSVPSIGGTSLTAALAEVERCERALESARTQARAQARREGKSVRNLFGESRFVSRASAERWTDQARSEGEKAIADIITRGFNMDESPPFQHLVKRLKREGMHGQQAEGDPHKLADAILKAAARAKTDGSGERPLPAPDTVAGRILAAGTRARTPTGGHKDD